MAGHLLECGAQVTRRLLRRPGLQGRARPGRASASRSPRSTPTAAASSARPPGTGGWSTAAHGQGATALRGARPGGLPHARRRRRHLARPRSTQVGPDRVRARAACAATPRPTRSRSTSATRAAGWPRARSPTPGRAPRRARGWPPTSCASACATASAAARRPDRRRSASSATTPAAGSPRRADGDARDVRLRVAAAHADRGRGRAAGARGDGALHLRPGRRRRRAHRARAAAATRVSCLVPREAVPARFDFVDGCDGMSTRCIVPLHRAAHGRTGDKGDRSNISVIA